MKKIAKLSLVAAMAMTAANAGSLEEAIKGVNVSGKLYVESFVTETDNDGSKSGFEIDADIKLKNKINDNLTAVIDIEADTQQNEETATDDKQALELSNAYFSYTNNGATVNAGRMDINTPNTDGEEGEGFVGMYTVGPVTAVGAHFVNNSGISLTSDINAAALLGSVGPVNAEAWYVTVSDHSKNTTLVASTKVADIALGARYATTDFEDAAKKDGTTYILSASGKVANVALRATYLNNDEDNAAFVTDDSSANTIELVNFVAGNVADMKAYAIGATVPVMENVSFALDYGWGEADVSKTEASEIVGKVSYKMAKSTTLTVRYADYTQEVNNVDTDKTHARLDLTYKF
ncbi:major outer membrane protein [Arcobacter roscoffensis]|uniref:Porin n=1 Tax=Arcobacter roscoffensis TaxID=2961520 RepID=A0ABY5E742_9BACT|nr:major outer membrane protein [Arcobacter roscoffensis]UTJ06858.1 porin [Arcobacter roscoffensis]